MQRSNQFKEDSLDMNERLEAEKNEQTSKTLDVLPIGRK